MRIGSDHILGLFFKTPLLTSSIAVVFILGGLLVSTSVSQDLGTGKSDTDQKEITEMVHRIFSNRLCPCQCGNYLPGSPKVPACFGCSVGKTELTYVLESLEAGKKTGEIILNLNSPLLIDVFADYTNVDIAQVWQKVKRAADEFHQTRVVLRTPGLTVEARRAVKIAECARLNGKFSMIQDVLIKHQGPWDWVTLSRLVVQYGLELEEMEACLHKIDVEAQISKGGRCVRLRHYE